MSQFQNYIICARASCGCARFGTGSCSFLPTQLHGQGLAKHAFLSGWSCKTAVLQLPQLILLCVLFVLFVSCAATPSPGKYYADRKDEFAYLAPGGDLYINADLPEARSIINSISFESGTGSMTGEQMSDFLDMTDSMTLAVYSGGSAYSFLIAARGRYPSGRGGIFFSASKDWEKKKSVSGIEYWYSGKSQLSMSLDAKEMYVSNADPFVPAPGVESPASLAALKKGSCLSGWMEKPEAALNSIISGLGLPIKIPAERIVFAVYQYADNKDEPYQAALLLETSSASQAAALVQIFTMGRAMIANAEFSSRPDLASLVKAFFTGTIEQNGNALVLKTGTLDGRDIALLFNTLSVYSN